MSNRAAITDVGSLNAFGLRLTVDVLSGGALVRDGVVKRAVTVEGDTHLPAPFPVDIFDTATAFEKLLVGASLPGFFGKEQGTAEALGARAVGMLELKVRRHRQLFRAERSAVGLPFIKRVGVLVEWNGRDAAKQEGSLVDVPGIESGVSGDIGGRGMQGEHGLIVQAAKGGDIAFVEGLAELSQHDIAVDGIGASRDAGAIAEEADLFFFGRAISLDLMAALFDAQATIGIAFGDVSDIEAAFDLDLIVVLTYPGKNVLDIKGDRFPQAGDFLLQGLNALHQQALEEGLIEVLQLGTQPVIARHGALDIKAVRGGHGHGSGGQRAKAQFKHEPGMAQQKEAQLRAVDETFGEADKKGLEGSTAGMRTRTALVTSGILLIDLGPIEVGKESAIVLNHGVSFAQTGKRVLVKKSGFCYHTGKLLLQSSCKIDKRTLSQELASCQVQLVACLSG